MSGKQIFDLGISTSIAKFLISYRVNEWAYFMNHFFSRFLVLTIYMLVHPRASNVFLATRWLTLKEANMRQSHVPTSTIHIVKCLEYIISISRIDSPLKSRRHKWTREVLICWYDASSSINYPMWSLQKGETTCNTILDWYGSLIYFTDRRTLDNIDEKVWPHELSTSFRRK